MSATDPGNLSVSTSFSFTVLPTGGGNPPTPQPTAGFSITGVSTLSCSPAAPNQFSVRFTPQYAGLDGSPISFSVVNELAPTSQPGPYTLLLYRDNPSVTLKSRQAGTTGEASFVYNWLTACASAPVSPGVRVAAEPRPETPLRVVVLGNPVESETARVLIQGADHASLKLVVVDERGYPVSQQAIGDYEPGSVQVVQLGRGPGSICWRSAVVPGGRWYASPNSKALSSQYNL